MKINKIRIRNFKRFEEFEAELSSFDCLVGTNNSGKSTFLQSLALFDFVLHNCLSAKQPNGNADNQRIFETKNRSIPPEEFVVLPVANAIDLWTDNSLAENLTKQEIAHEVHDLIYKLADFVGISVPKDNS
jgi:AAA15 family ATPase/GTPase